MSIPPKEEQLSQCPGMTKHRAKLSAFNAQWWQYAGQQPHKSQSTNFARARSSWNTWHSKTKNQWKLSPRRATSTSTSQETTPMDSNSRTQAKTKHPKPPQPIHTETPRRESKEYCCNPLHSDYSVCAQCSPVKSPCLLVFFFFC